MSPADPPEFDPEAPTFAEIQLRHKIQEAMGGSFGLGPLQSSIDRRDLFAAVALHRVLGLFSTLSSVDYRLAWEVADKMIEADPRSKK